LRHFKMACVPSSWCFNIYIVLQNYLLITFFQYYVYVLYF